MKKFYFLIIVALILGLTLTGCLLSNIGQVPTSGQSGGSYLIKGTVTNPDKFPLYAGQDILVGIVKVWNDDISLHVEYKMGEDVDYPGIEEGWVMTETHLAIAGSLAGIPQTKKNNPIPGQFPYSMEHDSVDNYTYIIPMGEVVSAKLFIAAHAEVHKEHEEKFEPEVVVNGSFEFPEVTREVNGNFWDIYPSGNGDLGWTVEWFDGEANYNDTTRPEIARLELHRDVMGWTPGCENQYATLDTDWEGPGGVLIGEPASVRIYQDLGINQYSHCTLSYAWSPRPGHTDNELEVYWNGVLLNTHSGDGGENTSWNLETLTNLTPSPSGTTKLEFIEVGTPDGLGMFLDCVSVICTIVQEETAWADGERFTEKGNWATYFTYTVQIDGLVLWLDAGEGITHGSGVSMWKDQSGNNNHATQVDTNMQPNYEVDVLNDLPVVRFDDYDYLEAPDDDSLDIVDAITIFTVTCPGSNVTQCIIAKDGLVTNYRSWNWHISETPGSSMRMRLNGVNPVYVDGSTDLKETWHLGTGRYDGAIMELWFDGELESFKGASGTITATEEPVRIGLFSNGKYPFNGDIAEILVYNRALSDSEREMVENYLNAKYNIY